MRDGRGEEGERVDERWEGGGGGESGRERVRDGRGEEGERVDERG